MFYSTSKNNFIGLLWGALSFGVVSKLGSPVRGALSSILFRGRRYTHLRSMTSSCTVARVPTTVVIRRWGPREVSTVLAVHTAYAMVIPITAIMMITIIMITAPPIIPPFVIPPPLIIPARFPI